MDFARRARHSIKEFVKGNRSDNDSNRSPGNLRPNGGAHNEKLDTSNVTKILVIGETGSGKSTFINYLANYFGNGSIDSLKIAIPSKFHLNTTEQFTHCENDIQNTTQSKTSNCNQYMFSIGSKQYLFIDTPGLSDTRGAEQDDKNIVKIVDSVENLGSLTAVIIVVNGAVSRLTVNLRNVLVRLRGNLPDIVMDNVILVLTNSTRHAANFSISALELNGNIYPYYMQNSAFSQDPKNWTSSAKAALDYDWNQAMDEIKIMIETIDTFKTKSVSAFKTMKDIRNEIKSLMHEAHLEVSQIQKIQDEIAIFDALIKQADNDLITYNDYTTEREVDKIEIVDAPFHSTLCQNCNHVCHSNCGLDETTIAGAQIFERCWAIIDGSCTQCPNNCFYTAHYHAKKTVQTTKEKLQDVIAEIKAKYDQAVTNKGTYQNKITSVEDAKKLLENALKQKFDDIKQLCTKLHDICSGFNLAQELQILIEQLEIEAKMLKNIDAKQQADAFIRSLKDLCNTIANNQTISSKNLPKMNIINTERIVYGQVNRITSISSNENSSRTLQNMTTATNSESYANEDVLATIRAITKKKNSEQNQDQSKKKTVKKNSFKKNSNTKMASSDIYTSDSEDEGEKSTENNNPDGENDDETKNQKSKKTKQSSTIPNEKELKQLSISELLDRYRACKDHRTANFFTFELKKRSLGESVDPLTTPINIAEFAANTQKYCALPSDVLKKEYERLKKSITAYTEPDILKIEQVPTSTLIEISAVYTLLQRVPPEVNTQTFDINLQNHQSINPFNTSSTGLLQTSSYLPLPNSSTLTLLQSNPNMMHHLDPRFNQQVYYPPPPTQHPTYLDSHQSDHRFSYTSPPCVYYNEQSNNQQQYVLKPIQKVPPAAPSNLSHALNNMRIVSRSTEDLDFIRQSPRSEHGSLDTNSQRSSPFESVPRSGNSNELGNMTNVQLIAAYNEAYIRRNHAQSNAFYNELKRRCYGDYPSLIYDNPTLFNEAYQKYQSLTMEELKERKNSVEQSIDGCLTGGDATHINEVSLSLIVEAGALNRLIGAKTPRT